MAYEYNPESARFNLPNPHTVENWFLGIACLAQLLGGGYAIYAARHLLLGDISDSNSIRPLIIGIVLLLSGLHMGWRIMMQLVFYFGRNQPAPLAEVVPPQQDGSSTSGEGLRETIRQNAISFDTPKSGFAQLLYRLVPDLVFSPRPVQENARAQFYNLLVLLAVSVCFAIFSLGIVNQAAQSWIEFLYFLITAVLVVRPLRITGGRLNLSVKQFVALIVFSAIGPVLLNAFINEPLLLAQKINFDLLTSVFLAIAIAANVLFLISLFSQKMRPAAISMANHTEVLSMNAHPRQIMLELDRRLQDEWTEKIPNRSYLRQTPEVHGGAGSFNGSLLEESQPVPHDSGGLKLASALGMREYRFLVVLDMFALSLSLVGVGLVLFVATAKGWAGLTQLLLGFQCLAVGRYSFFTSNFLWRRFEFTSRAYWLELYGNYQTSNVDYGRVLDDAVKTSKQVVNIEDMTLRMWVADLYSVSFGPDEPRQLISMSGEQNLARQLGQDLARFGREQRSLVAPTAPRDAEAARNLALANAQAQRDSQADALPRREAAAALIAQQQQQHERDDN